MTFPWLHIHDVGSWGRILRWSYACSQQNKRGRQLAFIECSRIFARLHDPTQFITGHFTFSGDRGVPREPQLPIGATRPPA
eukprot:146080-Prorocentrum_minimum.AAC.1